MSDLDAIVIGAGHNGLTCAAYLGMAGLKVRVFERRDIAGGACVTEEFHPGFRNSTAAYTVSLLQPKIIADLKLHEHGLRIVERRVQNFLPLPDGRYLLTGEGRTQSEIAKFSAKDATRYPDYQAEIGRVAGVLRGLMLDAPPNLSLRRLGLPRALAKLAGIGRRLWQDESLRAAFNVVRRSAGDILDEWFESDPIKAVLGFDAVVGNLASPYTSGSGYVLLHHALGEVNGKPGTWGHAIGGMGAITQAMARAAGNHGVRYRSWRRGARNHRRARSCCRCRAERRHGVPGARGDCQCRSAHAVPRPGAGGGGPARGENPHGILESGIGHLPHECRAVAPAGFWCAAGPGDHLTAGIIMAPSLSYMDQAYRDCVSLGWSRKPIVEMLIPSTLDDSLAPPGAHVASLFCQHVMPRLAAGASWDVHREAVADLMIDTVESYAPGFKASVIARQILSPLDLERLFGLPDGDIFHGAMSMDQLFSLRPMRGYADYRMPVPGLYLCGSGAHPGGGVTGAPGHNAAQAVIADLM